MKGKRIISSLLSMAMIFSLNAGISFADEAPVTEEPIEEEQPYEEPVIDEQPVIEENPVVDEEPVDVQAPETAEEEPKEEDEYPAQTFTGLTPDGKISVEVIAAEGALPKDSSMRVENVSKQTVTALVDPLVGGEIDSISAVDVIFTNEEGDIIEPLTEIIVKIKTNELKDADRYQLVHIDQANNAERISEEKVIDINKEEATFATDVFSIYVIVGVTETGAIDFDETFGSDHVTVHAPDGAFEPGTEMVISSIDGVEPLSKAVGVMDASKKYSAYGIDISFYKDGIEVEPALPVEVKWESTYAKDGSVLVHVLDDGTAQIVSGAQVSGSSADFTADSFSQWVLVSTLNHSEIDISNFTFNPSSIVVTETFIRSGAISETAPRVDGYTFNSAVVTTSTGQQDIVLEVGSFEADYKEVDDQGHETGNTKTEMVVFYRTEESLTQSDVIVLVAGDKIQLNYDSAPNKVTYNVVYNGRTYKIGEDELPSDLAEMVVSGPDYARTSGEPQAVTIEIPRGFSATVRGGNTTMEPLGVEPTYTLSGSTINKSGDYTLRHVYDVPASNNDVTFTINVTKRTNYTYDASLITQTKYFRDGNNPRYTNSTIDGAGNTTKRNFTSNTSYWQFRTTTPVQGTCWIMDSLAINGETVAVPFANTGTASETTTLSSGTVITVTVEVNTQYALNNHYARTYRITASNCYENITITGGNLYNSWNWAEYMPDVLENVTYDFYQSLNQPTWDEGAARWRNDWGVSQPVSIGNRNSDKMYWYTNAGNTMRFTVDKGYVDPEIAFVSSTEADLRSNIYGLSLTATGTDNYYKVTSNPDNNGYYWFSINGMSNNTFAMLRIRATLGLYDIVYDGGDVSGATMPQKDTSGYNVKDYSTIVVDKSAPVDPTNEYVFTYYTIDGDTSGTHYAPSQKVELENVLDYAVKNSETGRYDIKFIAHWQKKAETVTKIITVHYVLDGQENPDEDPPVEVQVLQGASVYVDIDSDTVCDFMDKYDWELYYDEPQSSPFIDDVQDDMDVYLHMYSKYYVYHSGTGELELHTSKEPLNNGSMNIANQAEQGYLYGGYYSNSAAHDQVQAAADYDREEGTLSAEQIVALSDLEGTTIATGLPVYDLNAAGKGDGYWSSTNAYTSDVTWSSDYRGKIFYIKEVPNAYLSNYYEIVYKKQTEDLTGLYLMSVTDDLNYNDTGLILQSSDSKKATVVRSLFFQQEGTGNVTMIRGNNAFNKDGVLNVSYLTYWKATGSDYFAPGTFTVKPYWVTPDGVTVTGKTRTITITAMTKSGISKAD